MTCDCWIGILNSYDTSETNNLYLSDYIEKCRSETTRSHAFATMMHKTSRVRPQDYLHRGRGWTTLFHYCPHCGAVIDLKTLVKALK
jgi:hypothetical protein